ncbi:hypothetical protein Tco_0505063 [Tanacetum coccineum]
MDWKANPLEKERILITKGGKGARTVKQQAGKLVTPTARDLAFMVEKAMPIGVTRGGENELDTAWLNQGIRAKPKIGSRQKSERRPEWQRSTAVQIAINSALTPRKRREDRRWRRRHRPSDPDVKSLTRDTAATGTDLRTNVAAEIVPDKGSKSARSMQRGVGHSDRRRVERIEAEFKPLSICFVQPAVKANRRDTQLAAEGPNRQGFFSYFSIKIFKPPWYLSNRLQ